MALSSKATIGKHLVNNKHICDICVHRAGQGSKVSYGIISARPLSPTDLRAMDVILQIEFELSQQMSHGA
jgi:hypothetical protein